MSRDEPASRGQESDLEDRARDGDVAAVAELLELHRGNLVKLCRGYLGRPQDAEDAAQDVITKAVASMQDRWPQGSFRSWLYAVARNHSLNLRRRRGRSPIDSGTFAASQRVSPRTGPHTAVVRREREQQLHAAMASLPPALAEILFLRYVQDLGRAEIAAILEISESAAKARLARARRELALRVDRRGSREPE